MSMRRAPIPNFEYRESQKRIRICTRAGSMGVNLGTFFPTSQKNVKDLLAVVDHVANREHAEEDLADIEEFLKEKQEDREFTSEMGKREITQLGRDLKQVQEYRKKRKSHYAIQRFY